MEILPNIWLGNMEVVNSSAWLRLHSIGALFDCTHSVSTTPATPPLNNQIPIINCHKIDGHLLSVLANAYKTLTPSLVYCETGNGKSASLVAAFLIRYTSIEVDSAIRVIQTKRPEAFRPSVWGVELLQSIHEKCDRQNIINL